MQKIIPADAVLIPDTATLAFKGIIYDVYQWPQELYDGTSTDFEMLKRADTAIAICIVDDSIVVLDDTQPHRGTRLGFPGGRIDDTDEDALEGARREILEETGYKFRNWKLIRVVQPFSKIEWFIYEYLAWDCYEQGAAHNEPGERISVRNMPFEAVKELVNQDEGHLGSSKELFAEARTVDDLIQLPEFIGKSVDR